LKGKTFNDMETTKHNAMEQVLVIKTWV